MAEQETITLGIVGIKNMGVYDSETQYEKLNVVTYQGSSYCAITDTKGNVPTNTTYWQLYAQKGDKGDTGDTGEQGPAPVKGVDYYTAQDKLEIESDLSDDITSAISESVGGLVSATPLAASSTSDMTDTTRIYVNTTDGKWYYYDTLLSAWTAGGIYQATEVPDNSITLTNIVNSSIFKEKLNAFKNIINQASSVQTNKKITGYNTSTYLPNLGNSSSYNVYFFDNSTFVNNVITIPINRSDSTYQAIFAYKENVGCRNITNTANTGNNAVLDSSLQFMSIVNDGNYPSLAVTIPKNFLAVILRDIASDINYSIDEIYNNSISGKNINGIIPSNNLATNLYNLENDENVTILHNRNLVGYDTSTYLPRYSTNKDFSIIQIDLNGINSDYLKSLYAKLANVTTGNLIYAYHNSPSSAGALYNYSTLVGSGYLNPDTKIINLTKLLNDISNGNYNKLCIVVDNIYTNDLLIYYQLDMTPNLSINKFEIVTPVKYKVVNNMELPFFYQNMIRGINTDFCNNLRIHNDSYVTNLKNVGIHKSTTNGELTNVFFQGYLEQTTKLDFSKRISIQTIANNVGSGLNKKILFIGDSMTDADVYPRMVYELFNNDVMNITLLGTRGTAPYLEEGRSSWRAYTYVNCENGSDDPYVGGGYTGSNPFYNPNTESFDFSYYMTSQNYDSVDYVFINLGTNDIVRQPNTEADIIGYYQTMIDSIHDYDSNIKICLWLTPCRGIGNNYNNLPNDVGGKDKCLLMVQYLLNNFANKENENIYLIPVYSAIDPNNDYNTTTITIGNTNYTTITDSVHPANSGYQKIANIIYYWIKYLGSL